MQTSLQERRARLTVDSATEILKVFGLKELPTMIPHADETSTRLTLPGTLSEREIKTIVASARIYNAPWCLADISLWLLAHPAAPLSRDEVWRRLQRTGIKRQTLHNYQSVGRSFAPRDRMPALAFGYHDACSSLPHHVRRELMRQALKDHLTLGQFRELVQVRKAELEMGRYRKPSDRPRIVLNAISKTMVRCASWTRRARDLRALSGDEARAMERDLESLVTLVGEYKKLTKK